jgi:hypothetical protein
MIETGSTHTWQGRVLAFAAFAEVGTGGALIVVPTLVGALLLGIELSSDAIVIGRCFGVALLGLGMACWPGSQQSTAAFRAMLTYNALIALYLAYLGTAAHLQGLLLWPAVGLHAVVALALVWTQGRRGHG